MCITKWSCLNYLLAVALAGERRTKGLRLSPTLAAAALMDVVIKAQDSYNNIVDQLLKNERILGVMQKMVAKMAWKGFQQGPIK